MSRRESSHRRPDLHCTVLSKRQGGLLLEEEICVAVEDLGRRVLSAAVCFDRRIDEAPDELLHESE